MSFFFFWKLGKSDGDIIPALTMFIFRLRGHIKEEVIFIYMQACWLLNCLQHQDQFLGASSEECIY